MHMELTFVRGIYVTFYLSILWALAGEFTPRWRKSRWWKTGMYLWPILVYGGVLLRWTWVTDDAYILFRSLEQVMVGRGPVWNPLERVQGFTSPLWFLVLLAFRLVSSDVYLNAVIVQWLLNGVLILLWIRWLSPRRFWLAVMLAVGSSGFMDFATSGLEDPLGYLLLWSWLVVGVSLHRHEEKLPRRLWYTFWVLSFLIWFARLDWALLVLPGMVLTWWRYRTRGGIRYWLRLWALSGAPLWLWSLFALVFYGTPLPNTFYAKVLTGIPRRFLWVQGFKYYFGVTALLDPIIPVVIVAGIVLGIGLWWKKRALFYGGVALGLVAGLVYVGSVGGDFMRSRFLTPIFALAHAALLTGIDRKNISIHWLARPQLQRGAWTALLVGLSAFLLFFHVTPLNRGLDKKPFHQVACGIADERAYYCNVSGFRAYLYYHFRGTQEQPFPPHIWAIRGWRFRQSDEPIQIQGSLGFFGYWAGTEKMVVDFNGLTDAFLARLPAKRTDVRVGHFARTIPHGYLESQIRGKPMLEKAELNQMLSVIYTVTRGPLWTWERWKAIGFLLVQGQRRWTGSMHPRDVGPPKWHKDHSPLDCARTLRTHETLGLFPLPERNQ